MKGKKIAPFSPLFFSGQSPKLCERSLPKPLDISGMRWLPLVGSLKLQVSFAEYSLFYKALAKETNNFKEPTNRSHPIDTDYSTSSNFFLSFFPKPADTARKSLLPSFVVCVCRVCVCMLRYSLLYKRIVNLKYECVYIYVLHKYMYMCKCL